MKPEKIIEKSIKSFFITLMGLLINENKAAVIPDIRQAKSALVLRPDRLGDFILAVPAISLLRQKLNKDAKMTIVAGKRGEDIARLFFSRDDIIVYNRNLFSFIKVCLKLFLSRCDFVINFHSYPFSMTSAIMTLASKCKIRIGFKEAGEKNELGHKIYNKGVVLYNDILHESQKDMMLLKPLKLGFAGKIRMPEIVLPDKPVQIAKDFYKEHGIKEKDFVIGIHPTLKKKDNRWEKKNYRDLILAAQKKYKAKTVVVYGLGEEDEIKVFRQIIEGIKDAFILQNNGILDIMAAAQRFNKFVCNDSGIMHAVSLVSDTVAIFGPSTAKRWSPIGDNKVVILQKKDGNCDSVSVKEVLRKISG